MSRSRPHGDLPNEDKLARKVILEADQYDMTEQVLYHVFSPRTKGTLQLNKVINKAVVPKCLWSQILSEYHDSLIGGGHHGFDRTYYAIKMKYYWRGMYVDVNKYVKTKIHYKSHPAHSTHCLQLVCLTGAIWTSWAHCKGQTAIHTVGCGQCL